MSDGATSESGRARLGAELRRLRAMAGMSGKEMGDRIETSQSKVSRIETGASLPTLPTVVAWADAARADPGTRDRLSELTKSLFEQESINWSRVLPRADEFQRDLLKEETHVDRIRAYADFAVPGLLQTPDYARRALKLFTRSDDSAYLDKLVQSRRDRQRALLDETRRFSFLLTEAALRRRLVASDLQCVQLDHVDSVSALGNVSIGVIPETILWPTLAFADFNIYDYVDGRPTAAYIEAPHSHLSFTESDDLRRYNEDWDSLTAVALYGSAAREKINEIRRSLSAGTRGEQ